MCLSRSTPSMTGTIGASSLRSIHSPAHRTLSSTADQSGFAGAIHSAALLELIRPTLSGMRATMVFQKVSFSISLQSVCPASQ